MEYLGIVEDDFDSVSRVWTDDDFFFEVNYPLSEDCDVDKLLETQNYGDLETFAMSSLVRVYTNNREIIEHLVFVFSEIHEDFEVFKSSKNCGYKFVFQIQDYSSYSGTEEIIDLISETLF